MKLNRQFALAMAASLVTAGLALPVYADDAQQNLRDAGSQAQNAAQSAGSAAGDAARSAGSAVGDAARSARDAASSAGQNLQQQFSQGAEVKTDAKPDEVRQALAKLITNTVKEDGLSEAVKSLDKSDQARLQDVQSSQQNLNQTLTQLRDAYKQKYNTEFQLEASDLGSDESAEFVQAEIRDPSQLQQWPMQASSSSSSSSGSSSLASGSGSTGASGSTASGGISGGTSTSSDPTVAGAGTGSTSGGLSGTGTSSGASSGTGASAGTDTTASGSISSERPSAEVVSTKAGDLKQGDTVAVLRLPGQQQQSALTVSAVREEEEWRIAIPQSVDAQKLTQNLQTEFTRALEMKDRWPADAAQARKTLAHRVLMAYYDVSADSSSQQPSSSYQPTGGSSTGGSSTGGSSIGGSSSGGSSIGGSSSQSPTGGSSSGAAGGTTTP